MTSPTAIAEGSVIWYVHVVGLPLILVAVVLSTGKLVSSNVLVIATSVAPDCSIPLPSLE